MRKREMVAQWWEWRDEPGGVPMAVRMQRASAHKHRRDLGGKVYRVTRYRLAPLVEVSGWREMGDDRVSCGSAAGGASVIGKDGHGRFYAFKDEEEEIQGRGGRPEAEAALALLGYRVRKEDA
jgi:hypothetical protein